MHSKGEDAFTALHYASFNGNLEMIKLLIKHGASINAVNKMGINMLHVAAQGDQPLSLAYFR
jgi:palmitoyltransferase ZDHHC13/17